MVAFWVALHAIKSSYDPEGLLWCRHCVGSEAWVERDGRLCPAPLQHFKQKPSLLWDWQPTLPGSAAFPGFGAFPYLLEADFPGKLAYNQST